MAYRPDRLNNVDGLCCLGWLPSPVTVACHRPPHYPIVPHPPHLLTLLPYKSCILAFVSLVLSSRDVEGPGWVPSSAADVAGEGSGNGSLGARQRGSDR